VSGYWEIEASVSPARVLIDGTEELLVRVQITDLDSVDSSRDTFIDLRCPQARQIALEILAAADDADWQDRAKRLPAGDTMSAPNAAPTTSALTTTTVPDHARALAARLASLFQTDQEIVLRLNDAHHRLAAANDRLWTRPATNPVGVHHQIHRAFWTYQHASEQRRQLAVDVGELSQQLTDALTAAGYSRQQARSANVEELAASTWQPTDETSEDQR
jgi:hypothetical protein